jgi:aconitate decarboxylase
MAAKGFTADADALGGPRGWGRSLFGAAFDAAPILAPLAVPRILDPGPAWKLFPSQYGTHFAITAALEARTAIADPAQIESVTLVLPSMPYLDRPVPASGLAGKFSWQYVAAVALIDGRVDPKSFSDARRFAPDMEAMLGRVRLEYDAEIRPRFDLMHVSITVTLRDGTVIGRRCDAPLGNWRKPAPDAAVHAKARGLFDDVLGAAGAAQVIGLLDAPLDTLAIAPVMEGLRGRATP